MMKLSSILAVLSAVATVSVSAEKPPHTCANGVAPTLNLGGYNLLGANFAGDGVHAKGLDMVEKKWRKTLTGSWDADIWPSTSFNSSDLVGSKESDAIFQFELKNGYLRGVGVRGGDSEISDSEGVFVSFGGLCISEVAFGVRALFAESASALGLFNETGIVSLYKGGVKLDANVTFANADGDIEFSTDGNDGDDGQESFYIRADVEFDAISFITLSHHVLQSGNSNHDYFLEYVDLCYTEPQVTGDPHIETWSGMKFDFHGVCDLVLLQNPDFEEGLGMEIHVRTKQLNQFSYVSSAVLRIGDDTLEVMGDIHENLFWINRQAGQDAGDAISTVGFINGHPISHKKVNSKQHEFVVDIGGKASIIMRTFKKFVHVGIQGATEETFGSSAGLLGAYGSGKMLARDGTTVLDDPNAFGQEWQVLPHETVLFHNVDGPQAPQRCLIPVASSLRRRLGESKINEREAEIACSRVSQEDFDMCVFDVMATGDKDVAGAY